MQWAVDQQPYLQGFLAIESAALFLRNGNVIGGGTAVLTGQTFIDKSNINAVVPFAKSGKVSARPGGARPSAACAALVAFARGARHPDGGFGWFVDVRRLDPARPVELWITCRMTHVFALACAAGRDTFRPLVDHGVSALRGRMRDGEHGGWYAAVDETGHARRTSAPTITRSWCSPRPVPASPVRPGAAGLLDEALETFERQFWRESEGRVVDVWDRRGPSWSDYRGVNANMHAVEAMLAARDVLATAYGPSVRPGSSSRSCTTSPATTAGTCPSTSTRAGGPADYNRSDPATVPALRSHIGHLLEWSRLALHVRTGSARRRRRGAGRCPCLFDMAVRNGWAVDGRTASSTHRLRRPPGRPQRMHWVVAEARTAYALHR